MDCKLCEPSIEISFANNGNLTSWIQEQAQSQQSYLLAHADDGVIWGHFKQGKLTTSNCVLPQQSPPLRLATLQQCRVFGAEGEVLLWRVGDRWRWRFIGNPKIEIPKVEEVEKVEKVEVIKEPQLLWGTHGQECKDEGFTILEDGSQGLRHAVPLTGIEFDKDKKSRPVRLLVHHYITYDNDGLARISLSRLVDLTIDRSAKEN